MDWLLFSLILFTLPPKIWLKNESDKSLSTHQLLRHHQRNHINMTTFPVVIRHLLRSEVLS